jgi:hypothetical protein
MSMVPSPGSALAGPSSGNISDVVGLILEKGLVIDAYVRVSLVGIEVLTIDARVVVAGVETYMRFAEAAGRLNLEDTRKPGLPELIQGVAGAVTGAVTGAGSRASASLDPAQAASALPPGPGAGAEEHHGRQESERVPVSARRRTVSARRSKESGR